MLRAVIEKEIDNLLQIVIVGFLINMKEWIKEKVGKERIGTFRSRIGNGNIKDGLHLFSPTAPPLKK